MAATPCRGCLHPPQAAGDEGDEDSDADGAEWAPAGAAAAGSDDEMSDAASEDEGVLDELAAAGGAGARLLQLSALARDVVLVVRSLGNARGEVDLSLALMHSGAAG